MQSPDSLPEDEVVFVMDAKEDLQIVGQRKVLKLGVQVEWLAGVNAFAPVHENILYMQLV